MERRVLIAVLLSFVVLYGYQAMFPVPQDPARQPSDASKAATAPNAAAPEPANPTPAAKVQAEAAPGESGPPAREVVLAGSAVGAVFTTRGAAIKSWQLKKYRDSAGRPYEVVAGHAPAVSPLPLSLGVDDPALTATLQSAPFAVAAESSTGNGWTAQFEYNAGTL